MTDPATCLWRIVVVTDDPATRLGLLPGFEIALESSGSQFTALAQLTKQHGINRRMDHEQVPCSDQLVLVDTWRSTLEQLAGLHPGHRARSHRYHAPGRQCAGHGLDNGCCS